MAIRSLSLNIARIGLFALTSAVAATTHAATVSVVGNAFDVSFNGIVNGSPQAGLTGSAQFVLTNIASDGYGGENWDFSITLSNTSTAPITSSRISVLGFDTNPNVDRAESTVSGAFNIVGGGNLAQIGNMELCFKEGGSSNNCSGGGNGGVTQGNNSALNVRLNFNSDISELALTNFAVRYQSIAGDANGTSGAGVGAEVPLPASAFLFGSTLAALGWRRRASK